MKEAQEWSLYWSQGHVNSFGDTTKQNYKGVIRNHWLSFLNKVKEGETVLDLCTGNASLLRLAEAEIAKFSKINFIGVDYATIDQSDTFFDQKNINVMSNQNVEKLALEDQSIDYVCSNFGVEYSNIENTSLEVLRVLISGGIAQYICHDKGSKLIKDSVERVTFLEDFLKPDGAVDALRKLVFYIENNIKNDESETIRNQLNNELSSLLALNKLILLETQVLDFLKVVMNPKTINKTVEVEKYKNEMQSYLNRLRFMVEAALTEADLNQLIHIINNNNGKILVNMQVIENKNILCRKIIFIKN